MVNKVKVVVVPFHALPCSCREFTVNGIDADVDDFGRTDDCNPGIAEQYGCGDRQFLPKYATDAVLAKYGITLLQYAEICELLKDKLAVGMCGWCV